MPDDETKQTLERLFAALGLNLQRADMRRRTFVVHTPGEDSTTTVREQRELAVTEDGGLRLTMGDAIGIVSCGHEAQPGHIQRCFLGCLVCDRPGCSVESCALTGCGVPTCRSHRRKEWFGERLYCWRHRWRAFWF